MSEIANFFWDGNELSIYEKVCLLSFIKNDFIVRVWSFSDIRLPKGCDLMDANEILTSNHLEKYTQAGQPKNLAAFSDVFRFNLLSKKNGEWWFDIDCVCLKNQKEFKHLKQGKKIVLGWEDKNFVNGACLNFTDSILANELVIEQKRIIDNNLNLNWGEIGPKLLTKFVNNKNITDEILPINIFYPIHYTQVDGLNNPNYTKSLIDLTKDSYVCHLWNEILSKKINKKELPNKNSFLESLFLKFLKD